MDDPRYDLQKQVGGYWELGAGPEASIADDIMRRINPGNAKAAHLDMRLIQHSKNIFTLGSQRLVDPGIKSMSDYIDRGEQIPGFSAEESKEISRLYKKNVHQREEYDKEGEYNRRVLDKVFEKYRRPISIASLYGICDLDDPQNVLYLDGNPEPIWLDLGCKYEPSIGDVSRSYDMGELRRHIKSPLHQELKEYVLGSLELVYGADSDLIKKHKDSFAKTEKMIRSGDLSEAKDPDQYPTVFMEKEGVVVDCDRASKCEPPRAIQGATKKTEDGFTLSKGEFGALNKVKSSHPMDHLLPLTTKRLEKVTGRVSEAEAKFLKGKSRDGTEL